MSDEILLKIDGEVEQPRALTFADLAGVDSEYQVIDVRRIVPARAGDAVRLEGLIQLVRPKAGVRYLGLHASRDNFHASIPLDAIAERALVIYRLNDQPLPASAGGPVRFFIPDHAACHTDEIDECANVKFVDHIEFTREKGFDNRPHDEAEHEQLHARENG